MLNLKRIPRPEGPMVSGQALKTLLGSYLATLASSPHTRRAYGRHLRGALAAIEASALEDLAPWRLEAWREQLFQDGRSPATHAQALSALRSFLGWIADQLERDIPRAVLSALKMPKRIVLRPTRSSQKRSWSSSLALRGATPGTGRSWECFWGPGSGPRKPWPWM